MPEVSALPALPWEAGAGGTINLRNAVTTDELLDGVLTCQTKSNGQLDDDVHFVTMGNQLQLVAGQDTVFNVALSADGKTLTFSYAAETDIYNLESVTW